ncbi:MAG: hypothetical protein HFE80_10785 [Clostridiaceae bacterium]|jgi:hypothetical protein|nr:hypothetical protein [Clostridiaceae bacterium]
MNLDRVFISQNYGRLIYKHRELPVYITDEFDFYRCVEFKDEFYGRTASCLFNGNLRECTGRYSKLFPNQKISYWADSPDTARAEIKKHGAGSDILTFWAYDDGSSTFPTLKDCEPLIIIDGRKCGIQDLIDKVDNDIQLTKTEHEIMRYILDQNPDCLAFDSHAQRGGENFIFFEKGFRKLALRQLKIRLGRKNGGIHNQIICADTSDYSPCIEAYGNYFMPKAKIVMNQAYLESSEYLFRKQILKESYQKICEAIE